MGGTEEQEMVLIVIPQLNSIILVLSLTILTVIFSILGYFRANGDYDNASDIDTTTHGDGDYDNMQDGW